MIFLRILIITISFLTAAACTGAPGKADVEIGDIKWRRDYDVALIDSAKTGRPVFLFFQEVPGCSGCKTFGKDVLTHPLMVEAIEDEFIPVLVYNNRFTGPDKELLKLFNEPSWNYQVIRFINSSGKDIIPRKDKVWTLGALATRMIETLNAVNRSVPQYLKVLAIENTRLHQAEGAFAMYCFWTGEVSLGQIDGVISTEAGWFDGHEVTRVVYDSSQISLSQLTRLAQTSKCAPTKVYVDATFQQPVKGMASSVLDKSYRVSKASDQKKQIGRWRALHRLPGITAMQKTKVNAFIHTDKKKALRWLSPRQLRALQ